MKALDRKLLRDLALMKGQVITIALVVACGIASYVAIEGTHASLLLARDTYYERQRFADVFAHLESAPDALTARLASIAGVAFVQTRILDAVRFTRGAGSEPATGHVISLPTHGEPRLGGIMLRAGRMLEPGRSDEVIVLESFAKAHGLRVGQRLPVVLAGRARALRIVGIALSPEYVFAIAPGEMMPDPKRFGVLWMDHEVVSAAFGMEGAWNDLLVRLQPGASSSAVIEAVNRELSLHGGLGAYARDRQLSNNMLRSEITQLEMLTQMMPTIFLGVAAFLINVVLSRMVQLQRAQIAALKAIGYGRAAIGAHYLKLMSVIVLGGSLLGIAAGVWIGDTLIQVYDKFYHFPNLAYRLDLRVATVGVGVSLLSAVIGALASVRSVMRLPPAEAMRPESPVAYRAGLSGRLPAGFPMGHSARMVLRELERRPLRALLSSAGIAMGVALLVSGRFGVDAIDWFMQVQFEQSQRDDVNVSFRRPVSDAVLHELRTLPGVLAVEGQRALPVRYRSAHHARESVLMAHPDDATLRRVLDEQGTHFEAPEDGVLLSLALARILEVRVGDQVQIEVLEGARRVRQVRVSGLVNESMGLFGHMRDATLSRLLDDTGLISLALLRVDPQVYPKLLTALQDRPEVLAVTRRQAVVQMFREQTAGQMRYTTLILTIFAAIIASGVVYNNARIALSTRSRDLASLRVLGFRRREISAILISELAVHVVVALLPGMLLGRLIAEQMMAGVDPESFRFPIVISARTYAFAVAVTLGASLASALVVRRHLDALDLIGVLKSRE